MSPTVQVIAPTGRDAELITTVLKQNGVPAEVNSSAALAEVSDLTLLGPLLIAEEALAPGLLMPLGRLIEAQPSWSDLPILILTGSVGENAPKSSLAGGKTYARFSSPLGATDSHSHTD